MMKFGHPGEPWQFVGHLDGTDVWYKHDPDPNHAYVMGIHGEHEDQSDMLTLADVLTIMPRVANTDMTTQTAIIVRAWRDKTISDSWLFMDPYAQDCQVYSDTYKDYGFRLRSFPSPTEIRESIKWMRDQITLHNEFGD
jgi:hypothetical protein